jgi:capping protein alpha
MTEEISASEKAKIASRLMLNAPPCQFKEVFTDLRVLVNDDSLMKEHMAPTFAQYNKDQFIQVKLPRADDGAASNNVTLITKYGDLGNNRFLSPATQETFHFDHLKLQANDVQSYSGNTMKWAEIWRIPVQKTFQSYVSEHYRGGIGVVYAIQDTAGDKGGEWRLVLCIEGHYIKNQTSGRWRSEWIIDLPKEPAGNKVKAIGSIKIQAHLFEEGNVQLLTKKDDEFSITVSKSPDTFADELVSKIKEAENKYQSSIGENFQELPRTSLKALRQLLPKTKSKIDWHKLSTYNIGEQISKS